MPRPRRHRRVRCEPNVNYFKPAGIRKAELDEIILTVDEFEALRLKDLEGLDQAQAAEKMQVSQPTLHRILGAARKKIADALVNGKAIKIFGGNYKMVRAGRSRIGLGGRVPLVCRCSKCGHELEKVRGIPCSNSECPKCEGIMIRGD